METIKISYQGKTFKVQFSRIKAFPNDVFKIDFEENSELIKVMESPVYITEKPDRLALPEVQNNDQRELLMSFAEGIVQI